MRLNLKKTLALIGLTWGLLFSQPSVAGVIYNWINTVVDPEAGAIVAGFELERDAVFSGGVGVEYTASSYPIPYAGSPLLRFWLDVPGYGTVAGPIKTTCSNSYPTSECTYYGLPPDDLVWAYENVFIVRLDLSNPIFPAGYVRLGTIYHTFITLGGSRDWQVTQFSTDASYPCYRQEICAGGTGYWMADPTTLAEPAGGTTLLLGLIALAGLSLYRRRRRFDV